MARFNKEGRGKIISSVCHVNRVIFDVTQTVGKEEPTLCMWPTVDTEERNIDPLRDERVLEVLGKQGMEYCLVEIATWLFGREGVEEHRLKSLYGMAMNSKGQFIITERENRKVKLFDRRGQFMNYFSLPVYNVDEVRFQVLDVAVDMINNCYVLVKWYCTRDDTGFKSMVYTFNNNGEVHHQFSVNGDVDCHKCPAMIADSKRKVFITGIRFLEEGELVDVYQNDGQFLRSFGEGLLGRVIALALASNDRVIVLDGDSCVHMFSGHGDHLSKFKLSTTSISLCRIAFHHSSEHFVVADARFRYVYLHIYTKDGELVHSTQIYVRGIYPAQLRMIVTAQGYIAILSSNKETLNGSGRVFIVC